MKHLPLCLATVLLVSSSHAQIAVSSNTSSFINANTHYMPVAGAIPGSNSKYVDLKEGSPFFQDKWSKSIVIMQNGSLYRDLTLKLNLMENKIHYKDSSGQELVISGPAKEVKLLETGKGEMHFITGEVLPNAKQGWYLLLVNDTVTLLKGFKKTFEEHTSYGSATEYSIKTTENYIVFVKDQEYEVKKPADFTKIFPAQKALIEAEIKKLKSGLSKDEQMKEIATFCNTLLKNTR